MGEIYGNGPGLSLVSTAAAQNGTSNHREESYLSPAQFVVITHPDDVKYSSFLLPLFDIVLTDVY
jgi:hypothetical protein